MPNNGMQPTRKEPSAADMNSVDTEEMITNTITVDNNGCDLANMISVVGSIPPEMSYSTDSMSSCTVVNGVMTCQVGTVAYRSSEKLSINY